MTRFWILTYAILAGMNAAAYADSHKPINLGVAVALGLVVLAEEQKP